MMKSQEGDLLEITEWSDPKHLNEIFVNKQTKILTRAELKQKAKI